MISSKAPDCQSRLAQAWFSGNHPVALSLRRTNSFLFPSELYPIEGNGGAVLAVAQIFATID